MLERMSASAAQLQATIVALESQRAVLGDAVVDIALAPLKAQLAALSAPPPAAAAEHAQSLRQVTILFLDVVGSTTLSQRLDPEEVHAVMDGALTRCTAVVQAHGGKVLQYAGDNLLAVFGGDEAREDDAERAVHAGLALLAEGRSLGAEVLARHGHAGFDVRVGLHSGGVLLGGGVDAEGSIRGMAVNVAARMEQTAPPGALRISQDTYRQVQGLFDVQAQDPIAVKGVDEPVVTWLVQRARPRNLRSQRRDFEGVHTRLVGRGDEFQSLQAAWRLLHAGSGLVLGLVVAEAGLGKTRLLNEFDHWALGRPERCHHFRGCATPQMQGQPYSLLRDVLGRWLRVDDGDSAPVARRKIEHALAPLFLREDGPVLAEAHAHLLGHLLGVDFSDSPHLRGILDDPAQLRSRAFHAAAQALRRLAGAGGRPIYVSLDDLQWADEGTLDFLDHLCRANPDVPMLLLCLARPALFERRDAWRTRSTSARVELGPLGNADSRALAAELLQRLPEIPPDLVQLLTGRAEGNPFFMEELVKMLVDRGALRTGPGAWVLNRARLQADAVPATLQGVLQARLDRLGLPERLALQQASVIGMVFWEPALAALDEAAPRALPVIVQRQLVLARKDTSVQDAPEYSFGHQILREVAYETVLKRRRRELHGRAAAWLASQTGLHAEGLLGLTAEHYDKAGDSARACDFYTRAAEAARRRYAHETTLVWAANGLALVDRVAAAERPQLRWRLLDARERTLDLLGRRDEQRADLAALAEVAQTLADDRRRADLATRHCLLLLRTGDAAAASEAARRAMALAAAAGDLKLRLNAQRLLADTLARQGDVAAAEALVHDGLVEVRAAGLLGLESRFLNALTVIAAQRNDLMALLDSCRQATRLRHELGDRRNEAIGLATLGGIWMALGQLEPAAQALDDGLRLHRAVGDRGQEPIALANLSQLALWQGRPVQAASHARQALAVAEEVQARALQAFALWCLGQAELALDAPARAQEAFQAALVVSQATGNAYALDARAGLARTALARGEPAEALRQVEALLAHLQGGGSLAGTLGERLIDLSCWQVLQQADDGRAAAVLQRAFESLQCAARALDDAEMRKTYLDKVPEHRALVQAWASRQPA